VTTTNPKHGPGWIAAARVEEVAGKIVRPDNIVVTCELSRAQLTYIWCAQVAARKTIRQGCEACPDSEDVWLEAARLHTNENAKTILANAVVHLPNSVKIWLAVCDLWCVFLLQKQVLNLCFYCCRPLTWKLSKIKRRLFFGVRWSLSPTLSSCGKLRLSWSLLPMPGTCGRPLPGLNAVTDICMCVYVCVCVCVCACVGFC
jgi:hypothetical protein